VDIQLLLRILGRIDLQDVSFVDAGNMLYR
jgi:hypothetical protein